MIIKFLAFFLSMFSDKILDKVSIVFPDFEIITKSISDSFSLFFIFNILSSSKSLKK